MFYTIQNISTNGCLKTTYDGLFNDKSDVDKLLKFLKIVDRLASMDIEELRELVEETYFNCEYNYHILLGIIKKEKEDTLKLFSI